MDIELLTEKWLAKLKVVLINHPESFRKIQSLCAEYSVREAYLLAESSIIKFQLPRSQEYEAASTDLYFFLR